MNEVSRFIVHGQKNTDYVLFCTPLRFYIQSPDLTSLQKTPGIPINTRKSQITARLSNFRKKMGSKNVSGQLFFNNNTQRRWCSSSVIVPMDTKIGTHEGKEGCLPESVIYDKVRVSKVLSLIISQNLIYHSTYMTKSSNPSKKRRDVISSCVIFHTC